MDRLQKQYQNADNLNKRISIHDYSTNKQGFGNWIVSHYDIHPDMNILELGCGTGSMWKEHLNLLKNGTKLTLSDFSSGMLESARENVGEHENITYLVADIQEIPFPDHSFDIVVANMMLYHVPDLDKALAEVRRVLKHGGIFYCATYGEHGISEYVTDLLREQGLSDNLNKSFTLQNGAEPLKRHFDHVQRFDYEDSLAIPFVDAFADYIFSLTALDGVQNLERTFLIQTLESRKENGILHVPKEYGMFVCR